MDESETCERTDLVFKRMEAGDLEEAVSIASFSPFNRWSRGMFLSEMNQPFAFCWTVRSKQPRNGPMVGFICFRAVFEESELLNLVVEPQHRRKGIGRLLMEFYIEFCLRMDIRTFYLEVSASNEGALRLYHSFSFRSYGTRKRFYDGGEDALLMVKRV